MFEAMLFLLLFGFGSTFYFRAQRAEAAAVTAHQRMATLDRQVVQLNGELAAARAAECKRREEGERRRRYYEENDVSDIANQIKFVSRAELRAVRPVNKEAVRVLYALDEWIAINRPGWRLSFEVAMGAFIKTTFDSDDRMQKAVFSSYNSKRVDFLLIDRFGQPMLAVEYHGTGHELSDDASDRMQVKRLALARAGVPLAEIPAKASKQDILRMIENSLAPHQSAAPHMHG